MSYGDEISKAIWEAGCFRCNIDEPFTLKSARRSPFYFSTDNALSKPETAKIIAEAGEKIIRERLGDKTDDYILAGGELRGVPFAAQLAYQMNLPSAIVRKTPKEHGAKQPVESLGNYDGSPFILVEDLITDGGSKIGFIEALREYGDCNHCLTVVDREEGGRDKLSKIGVELFNITTANKVFEYILKSGVLSDEEVLEINEYRNDPNNWYSEMKERLNR